MAELDDPSCDLPTRKDEETFKKIKKKEIFLLYLELKMFFFFFFKKKKNFQFFCFYLEGFHQSHHHLTRKMFLGEFAFFAPLNLTPVQNVVEQLDLMMKNAVATFATVVAELVVLQGMGLVDHLRRV